MKVKLYYFTGTGNSLAAMKYLKNELAKESYNVELIPIASLIDKDSVSLDANIVGIAFPVYCQDIPSIVRDFIGKLVLSDEYIFGIATSNGASGNSLFVLDELLKKKGGKLRSGFSITMPGNNIVIVDLVSRPKKAEKRIIIAKERIKDIAEIIKKRRNIGIEGRFNNNETYQVKKYLEKYGVAKHFWFTEACDLCGTCVEACPKSNIEISDDKVVWGDNCEWCLACYHWCPQGAIKNGKSTENARQYHHPDVSVEEIIAQK